MIIRLRFGDKVTGYSRTEDNKTWYSRNMSAWSGQEIEFDQLDQCTGCRDKNNRLLFEKDIIKIKNEVEEMILEIVFDPLMNVFLLKEFYGEEFHTVDLLKENQHSGKISWYSYSFLQDIE